MFLLHFGFGRLKICYFELTFVITRFILYSFKNLKSLIGIAIDVIVIEDLEVKWSRSTCVFNLIIGIWGIGLVFHCYLDLDLQWIGLNCWGWVRVADWLFIFWININWLSLQTIAFVFFFVYSWNGAALPLETYGYIRVDCYGGLNQMRRDVSTWRELLNLYSRSFKNLQYSFAAFLKLRRNLQWFQFCDGVGIARLLNATLVLPKFEVASYWNETRQFTFLSYNVKLALILLKERIFEYLVPLQWFCRCIWCRLLYTAYEWLCQSCQRVTTRDCFKRTSSSGL